MLRYLGFMLQKESCITVVLFSVEMSSILIVAYIITSVLVFVQTCTTSRKYISIIPVVVGCRTGQNRLPFNNIK